MEREEREEEREEWERLERCTARLALETARRPDRLCSGEVSFVHKWLIRVTDEFTSGNKVLTCYPHVTPET